MERPSIVACPTRWAAINDAVNGLDPMTLLLWANSFVKAGHADADLYDVISITAIPMLSEFDLPHYSNLSYAFELAGDTMVRDATGRVVVHLAARA